MRKRAQRALDIVGRERRQQQAHIAERLDILAAIADRDDRTEHRIAMRADHEFALPLRHRGDDDAVELRLLRRRPSCASPRKPRVIVGLVCSGRA